MNLNELKELVSLVSDSDVSELELEDKGFKVKIKKNGDATTVVPSVAALPVAPAAAPTSPTPPTTNTPMPEPAEAADTSEPALEDGLTMVTSPMVGTFYRQPQPGAEPFVQKGDSVKKGQVLCIIEAMKLMNEIECEMHGVLEEIFVDNGHAVQFGDRLFAIREA